MEKLNKIKCSCRMLLMVAGTFLLSTNLFAIEQNIVNNGKKVVLTGKTTNAFNGHSFVVEKATDNQFYTNEISGNEFSVTVNDIPEGVYTVKVYLAEHNTNVAGKRVFNITACNTIIAENLDIFSLAGIDKELLVSKAINYKLAENDNKFKISFTGLTGAAKFNTIVITKESGESIVRVLASQFDNKVITNGNPFVKHIFTADPSARVFEGKMYVYPSHDRDDAKGFNMTDYHVFSSGDLLNWEDHGVVLDVKDVPWAKEYMWAPDCIYKNGTYYFYFPARNHEGEFRIGVATSKSPTGPFIPEPEPIKGSFSVDPGMFIDDDGQAYMYFAGAGMGGQKNPWVAKMTNDMKEFDGAPKELTGVDYWFEACWMNKIGNTYYMSYSTGGKHPLAKGSSGIAYATSDSPLGPFKHKGLVNNTVTGWTNHHSIVEWKGQWYLFYHTSDLSGGKTAKRCIAADYLHVTDDGTIHEIVQTKTGIGRYDGLARIEAENYSETAGINKKGNNESGIYITFDNKDFVVFNNVDFGDKTIKNIQLSLASGNKKGVLEIREKGKKGKLLAKIPINSTSGDKTWKRINSNITEIKGMNEFAIRYKGKKNDSVNLDWFIFSE